MKKIEVIHFINQFFAGVGGEDKANIPVTFCEGAIGPGKRLQALLGDSAEIITTVYCGDDYFAKFRDDALDKILKVATERGVKMVIAGPAFSSGRYGFSCIEVCHHLSSVLGLYCITAMHIENPGLEAYREYKDVKVFALPTEEGVLGMNDALSRVAQFVSRLVTGTIGSASEDGYIPRGLRIVEVVKKSGAQRGIDMLLDRIAGRSFISEIPLEDLKLVPPAPPIKNLADICIALVTTSGVVADGNPDGFKMHRNTQWRKYSIQKLNSMQDVNWDVRHGGYDTHFMLQNANYGVPLDICRELEREKAFSKLYDYFYVTPGIQGLNSVMMSLGKEIALDMKAEGIQAALLVST